MNPGEPLSTRAPRMKTYEEMVRDLDSGGAHYSQDLSEVDLTDLEDVKVRVNDPAGDVLVHLGSSDYLRRYKIYVSHAQAWRQQFQKLESVDLRYDNQIIVNPEMQRTAKAAPALSPAVAKAAAAAGVKPAALVTRLPPHDLSPHGRAVPKPAFELTEKKLDPKARDEPSRRRKKGSRTAVQAAIRVATRTRRPAGPRASSSIEECGRSRRAPDSRRERRRYGRGQTCSSQRPMKHVGGQKPSPAIAKSQTSQGPGE